MAARANSQPKARAQSAVHASGTQAPSGRRRKASPGRHSESEEESEAIDESEDEALDDANEEEETVIPSPPPVQPYTIRRLQNDGGPPMDFVPPERGAIESIPSTEERRQEPSDVKEAQSVEGCGGGSRSSCSGSKSSQLIVGPSGPTLPMQRDEIEQRQVVQQDESRTATQVRAEASSSSGAAVPTGAGGSSREALYSTAGESEGCSGRPAQGATDEAPRRASSKSEVVQTESTCSVTSVAGTPNTAPPGRPSSGSSSKTSRSSWGSSLASLVSYVSKSTLALVSLGQSERPRGADRLIRKFRFLTRGVPREVHLAHDNDVWHLKLDSKAIGSRKHRWGIFTDEHHVMHFSVSVPGVTPPLQLKACLDMTWKATKSRWYYELYVGETQVPPYWIIRCNRDLRDVEPPEVFGDLNVLEEARTTVTEDRVAAHKVREILRKANPTASVPHGSNSVDSQTAGDDGSKAIIDLVAA